MAALLAANRDAYGRPCILAAGGSSNEPMEPGSLPVFTLAIAMPIAEKQFLPTALFFKFLRFNDTPVLD